MMKVPEICVSASLLSWMRNQTEFLSDAKSYSNYLALTGYGIYTETDLLIYQVYLNQFAKYLFHDGMNFELCLDVSINKRDKEIFFTLHKHSHKTKDFDSDSFMHIEFSCYYNDILADFKNSRDIINQIK